MDALAETKPSAIAETEHEPDPQSCSSLLDLIDQQIENMLVSRGLIPQPDDID
jgi:hypothetical protein